MDISEEKRLARRKKYEEIFLERIELINKLRKNDPITPSPKGVVCQANVYFDLDPQNGGAPIISRIDGKRSILLPLELHDLVASLSDKRTEEESAI